MSVLCILTIGQTAGREREVGREREEALRVWQAEDAKSRTAESLILRPEIEWAINRSVVGRSVGPGI